MSSSKNSSKGHLKHSSAERKEQFHNLHCLAAEIDHAALSYKYP